MNMSPLMTVQPLLDTGKNAVSGTNGKTQGGESFQSLLKDQMSANKAEKPAVSKEKTNQTSASETKTETKEAPKQESTNQSASSAAKEENKSATAPTQSEEQVAVDMATDTAVLAQVMAAAAGAQMVPVETTTPQAMVVTDETDLALSMAVTADGEGLVSDKALKEARDIKTLAAKADTSEGDLLDGKLATEAKTDLKGELKADLKGELKADVKGEVKTDVVTQAVENATVATGQKVAATGVAVAGADKAVPETVQTQLTTPQPVQQTTPAMATQPVQVAPTFVGQANQAANQIVQRMGTPEWNQAVGQRVMWMIGQEQQSASLTLNPPELGPVRIVVNVSNNQATANFFSANPDVRQALEGSLPRLREMMEGAGIQLGQAQVGAENSGNSQQEQLASSGNRTQSISGGHSETGDPISGVAGDTQSTRQVVSKGLVDTFV